ncbi:DUF4260 domain-containing protein [Mucilaginibacter sp. AW1-3]
MKTTIKLEEVALTIASIYFLYLYNLGLSVWVWIPLFLSPDISMLGYLINTRAGAFTYNLFHHRGLSLALAFAGYLMHVPILLTLGILLLAHSSFDRMLGYGLKYNDSFKHTHLGWLPDKTKAA